MPLSSPSASEPEVERIARIYDQLAPTWNEREARGERMLLGAAWRPRLASLLAGDVLEIGTGTGPTLRELARNPGQVRSFTGIDLSAGMLARARQEARACPFPVRLEQMDASDLSAFPDDRFDTVTASLVLCTVPDPARTLREMARVCRPSGRVVLLEHVLAPNRLVAWLMRRLAPLQVRHMGCHIDRRTDQLVRELGCAVERDETRVLDIFRLMVLRPPA